MKNFGKIIFTVLVIASVFSCGNSVVYTQYERFDEDKGWAKNYQPKFEFTNSDTNQLCDVYINVRNAESYPYRNLFMFLHTTNPKGVKTTDTIECVLADDKGKWMGNGLGDLYDNVIIYKKNTRFKQLGKYTFSYEQAMRYGDKNIIDPLPLIMDVGITIEKAED
ncbi:MAG TPA: gliding motility lipoprotein GldH [Bacteroidia bacterium]|jgi:gliding motility-associated lipoprotein GldH|nr:gliding motility lipoprotein GldH [Bacteroidia bacterium]